MSDCPNTNKIRKFGLPASFPWETNSFPRYKLYATVDVIPVKSVVVRDRSFVNMQSLYMVTTYWYTIIEHQNIALETDCQQTLFVYKSAKYKHINLLKFKYCYLLSQTLDITYYGTFI